MIHRVKISTASAGATAIKAADSNYPIRLLSLHLFAAGAVTAKLSDGTNDLTGAFPLTATLPLNLPHNPVGHVEAPAGSALNLVLGGAVQVDGVAVVEVSAAPFRG